jgi:hypothetical protein
VKTVLARRDQANQLHSIVDMEMRRGLCIVVGVQGSVLVVVVIVVSVAMVVLSVVVVMVVGVLVFLRLTMGHVKG